MIAERLGGAKGQGTSNGAPKAAPKTRQAKGAKS